MYTIPLSPTSLTVEAVGTKAASLGTLLSHSVRVPPGFIVSTAAHRRFLEANTIEGSPGLMHDVNRDWSWPPDLVAEITHHLEQYPAHTRWAVRSSGVLEDLADASFAGQYDTFLDVPKEALLDRIRDCWSSLANAHAEFYAREHGLSLTDTTMAVIVQTLVNADVAGVSFSRHPVTGSDSVVINAAYGLGESVVSGMVTPDSFEVDKLTQSITSQLGFKECQVRRSPGGGTEVIETSPDQQNAYCLKAHHVLEIASVTHRLETLAGHPVDVEWALHNDTLYCLQMRPITRKTVGGMHS